MFKKILYPTDFSDAAVNALAHIKPLKRTGGREVIVLHVINQRIIDGLMRISMAERDIARWQTKAEEVAAASLDEIKRELERLGFTVRTMIRTGFPWNVILDVEKKEEPSLIVIGSHGRTNLSDMLLGSVSRRVIRRCKRTVLVVKPDTGD